ncbi:MAG TPA: hypothetical protein VG297_09745 [Bryobacteraceae bacterium]|jgi:hypothetical protein|nr:hypothetical protein [Bryobacteraceae bacterium]
MLIRFLLAALVSTIPVLAEGAADRVAIEKLIQSLGAANVDSAVFTADAENDLPKLRTIQQSMRAAVRQPMSEVAPPAFVLSNVRFISPDVAVAYAAEVQLGTMPRKIPMLFVVKKESDGWKIAVLRLLAAAVP